MNKETAQKGIVFIPLIFAFVVVGVTSYVIGVKTGIVPFIAAPSSSGQIIGPYTRQPAAPTPTSTSNQNSNANSKEYTQNSSANQTSPKPTLSPQVATDIKDNWKTYSSGQYGYEVSYPADWELFDGNTETSRKTLIKQNTDLGYVDIQAFIDEGLSEKGKIQEAINAVEQKLKNDQNMKVNEFKSSIEGEIGGYIAQGEQTIDGDQYNFENRGLLGTNGKILLFHGVYKKIAPEDYLQKIRKIMTSFQTD
ncbi:hypothetical protein KKE78_03615 [Patescibacteria group bacterium]|nr:hypothetical protein [Patescibacteria group bacterium]